FAEEGTGVLLPRLAPLAELLERGRLHAGADRAFAALRAEETEDPRHPGGGVRHEVLVTHFEVAAAEELRAFARAAHAFGPFLRRHLEEIVEAVVLQMLVLGPHVVVPGRDEHAAPVADD